RYPCFVQTSLVHVLSCALKFPRTLRLTAVCVLTMPGAHQSPSRSGTGRVSSAAASHLSSLFSYSCSLFCIAQESISLLFILLRTLLQNHGGWGYPLQALLSVQQVPNSLRSYRAACRAGSRRLR